jgi:hypothetical protein
MQNKHSKHVKYLFYITKIKNNDSFYIIYFISIFVKYE